MKFDITHQNNKRAWALCPIHGDENRANLCISLEEPYYGYAKCFACGWQYKLSNSEMNSLGLKAMKKKRKAYIDWKSLYIEYYNNYRPAIEGKVLAKYWNVKGTTLSDFHCGWDGEAYTFPMRDGKFNCIGIQRRWPEAVKGSGKCSVEGSELGLFIPIFPYAIEDNPIIFICEGVSDACSVFDLGFNAIGRPNAQCGNEYIIELLDTYMEMGLKQVIIIPDNDTVGIKSVEDLAVLTVEKCKTPIFSRVFGFYGAKDIRDYIKLKGKDVVRKELAGYINEV